MSNIEIEITIPRAFKELFEPYRYKVYYGGRGGAKSWAFAMALLILGMQRPLRVLCARELQISISDSVHKLLADIVASDPGLTAFYEVQKATIKSKFNDTEFLFKGLKHNATEIKSTEGVDVCWVEEAEKVSSSSWELLIPTIRKNGSEIWVSFNPKNPTDATYQRFVAKKRSDAFVKKVSWRDNPFFTDVLEKERQECEREDPEAYRHIWEGEFDTRRSGHVYAKWIAEIQEEGRVIPNLYDPSLPVYTAWDLGYDDATAIWYWQIVHEEIRLIRYYENYGQDVEFYCKEIITHNYNFDGHYVPHDAANKLMAAGGRSIYQQMLQFGLKKVHVVPATTQQNGIEAARRTLKITWIDEDNCKDGVDCLMQYEYEFDEDKKCFKAKPLHNWASHGADAFEIIGQVWKNPKIAPAKTEPQWANQMTINQLMKLARKDD